MLNPDPSAVLDAIYELESEMPLVEVTMIEGRPADKRRKLIAALTETVITTLDAPRETVRVVICDEVPGENWGVAGEPKG